ncbi:MAG: hypothetical protein H0U74_17765 [Bradymonadaceae bacterium]|nr:hypothetical protein [Lujinxingiaceae bacterium]
MDWIFEGYRWFLANLGGYETFSNTRIVSEADFQADMTILEGPERAEKVFERIQAMMGIERWPCHLERNDAYEKVAGSETSTVASFVADGWEGRGVIRYRPTLAENLPELVTVLAHELGHYILGATGDDAPGGPTMEEPLTDLCSVFMGFGVFSTNAAFQPIIDEDVSLSDIVRQIRQPYIQVKKLAYLNQEDHAYALAISATLLNCTEDVSQNLTVSAKIRFHRALKHLRKDHLERVEHLRSIEGRDVRDKAHPLAHVRAAAKRQVRADDQRERLEQQPKKKRRKRFPPLRP